MKKKPVEIIIKSQGGYHEHSFLAELKDDKQLFALGSTPVEAIGKLFIQRQKELGFEIINR